MQYTVSFNDSLRKRRASKGHREVPYGDNRVTLLNGQGVGYVGTCREGVEM